MMEREVPAETVEVKGKKIRNRGCSVFARPGSRSQMGHGHGPFG